ncbi:MAG: anti-sigma factor [Bacteroidota bacterium]|nr:anti-sigma factor [Bacteroidota bacterium]MDX5448809.1 anti-sigma factor [Bacteroidota bacterium]MDX5506743.1 anti-sigma factor [Bacteroidota bacterium]
MDVKKYIESGILEDYIMGFCSKQERQEVECLSKIYPQIQSALHEMQDMMASWASGSAQAPPEHLREKVLKNLPPRDMPFELDSVEEPSDVPPPPPPPPAPKKANMKVLRNPWLYATAACVVAIIGLMSVYQDSKASIEDMKGQLTVQQQEVNELKAQIEDLNGSVDDKQRLIALLSRPGLEKIQLSPVKEDVEAVATIYWDPESGETYFVRNQLPGEPATSQYQLWSIHKRKPVSIGLVPLREGVAIQRLDDVEDADAFAITLEPIGGSESPTMDQMVVMGKV